MKNIGIKSIKKSFYEGKVYNLELKSNRQDEKDDLFFIEKNTGVVSHNCFNKDIKAFINWAKERNLSLEMCETADRVNERIRDYKDWLNIKGCTSRNNYE